MVKTSNRTGILIGIMVCMATLLTYSFSLSCGFINLDDPFYVMNNSLIKDLDPAAVLRIFSQSHLGTYLPLTYLSFAIDYQIWGDNPFGYHLTNSLLHGVNAFLVVLLADRLCRDRFSSSSLPGRWAYPGMLLLAGLLFSLHPLRVESVAWVSERKDVLNGVLTLAAILLYLRFARKREAAKGKGPLLVYLLALVFFILSLLAKQVSVTLPVILLLLDWYPLGRFRTGRLAPLVVEKIPFFAVAFLVTAAAIYFAAAEKILTSASDMPFYVRVVVSGNAIFEYCRLVLFPVGISPYFVLPKPLPYSYIVKTLAVVVISLYLFRFSSRNRGIVASWWAFIILLLPVLAFVSAGDDIAMAARYTYLPSIAPSIFAAAALLALIQQLQEKGGRLRQIAVVIGGAVMVLLAINLGITLKLIRVWQDTGSFWSRVIAVEPVGRAYGDRGVYHLINGRSPEAIGDFSAAIEIANRSGLSSVFNLYAFRGVALADTRRFTEAIADFDRAIAIYPHATYFKERGSAFQALGMVPEAEEDFRRAGPNPPAIDWFSKE